MRSSRRKRNQYVVDLRDHVYDLKKRKQDAITQNELLKQLTSLWERLCSEVESEIQESNVECYETGVEKPQIESTSKPAEKNDEIGIEW